MTPTTDTLKTITINTYKCAIRRFCASHEVWPDKFSISQEISMIEDDLHERFGMDWNEIETIEISVMKQY